MHKDVSLPAPAARSELNTGMEVKNQQSQQTISKNIEEKLNSACQILKKSSFLCQSKTWAYTILPTSYFFRRPTYYFGFDQAWEIKLRVVAQ